MKTFLMVFAGIGLMGTGWALDVPLTVSEQEGICRVANPINSGVPLPEGVIFHPDELRVIDEKGEPVLASIEPRCRWLGDNSLKWVTVHFLADVPANGKRNYRLVTSRTSVPESPLEVVRQEGKITVVTGPAKFIIPTDRLAPFEQVYLREEMVGDFSEQGGLLAEPTVFVLKGRNGQSQVQDGEAEIVSVEGPFSHTADVDSVEIEEDGPGRVVVALRGTFSTEKVSSLDFTSRLYFYANSSLTQITFSVRNRQLEEMARFVGIEQLALKIPMLVDNGLTAAIAWDNNTEELEIVDSSLRLLQSARDNLTVTLPDGEVHAGRRSEGWLRLVSGRGQLTAGNRWFWQTYPKGLEIRPDGTVIMELKAEKGERIDLYTAGSKTHFLFFHFSRRVTSGAQSVAAGTQFPLVALCDPDWYCQDTRVFGDLYSAKLSQFEPKYQELIGRFQKNVDSRIRGIVKNRPRQNWPSQVDEYGWLDFGSGLHHRSRTRETSSKSWWDSNYYDFPHAVLLNFVRTGDLINLRTAEEAGLHLADIDICHSFPGHPEYAGSPRSGPVIGHFRNYTRGRLYMGHSSFTFYKNESLYELYYLTGESWYRDVGLMSSDFAMARWGKGALRNLAHGIWGVLSAYHDTHEKKYLERAKFFVDEWGKPWQDKFNGSFDDQHWMYGLLFEAYSKYIAVTGDPETASYLIMALDALIKEFWTDEKGTGSLPGINVYGFGLGYEISGREEYFQKGLRLMELLARPNAEGDRVKTFAQNFRSSPYFLKYFAKGYRPSAR